ncbi:MAG TPA: DUF6285 domain-containing protein [Candidatus Binatia bacterium]
MQDRPTCAELLEAVQHFLETDAVPALDGPKKFHARVAANVLAIIRRELESEDTQLRDEWRRLGELLGISDAVPADRAELRRALRQHTKELCQRISQGDADAGEWRSAVITHVRHTVEDKLRVANPKYLSGESRG